MLPKLFYRLFSHQEKRLSLHKNARYLAYSVLLEESEPSQLNKHAIWFISFSFVIFLVWASLAPIKETAKTTGQIVPSASIHNIQHLEGGIIEKLFVKEGQIVEKGAPLLQLAPQATMAELEQMRAKQQSILLQTERLKAISKGKEALMLVATAQPFEHLAKDQMAIFELQKNAKQAQEAIIKKQISQKQSDIHILEEQTQTLTEQITLTEEQLHMQKQLLEKGLLSKVTHLQTQRELSELKGQFRELKDQKLRSKASLDEIENNLYELDARLKSEAVMEMGQLSAELTEINETIKRLEDRYQRLIIYAPTQGVVKEMRFKTLHTVIAPGELIMDIVPIDDQLIAEVKILPKDIGHIKIGQGVDIKLTTFDFTKLGSVKGIVNNVSASTFSDEEGLLYYKGMISLEKNYLGDNPEQHRILPGMIVQADIQTGAKTLMAYLLKPIYYSLENSFYER